MCGGGEGAEEVGAPGHEAGPGGCRDDHYWFITAATMREVEALALVFSRA